MLDVNPETRSTASQVLNCTWIQVRLAADRARSQHFTLGVATEAARVHLFSKKKLTFLGIFEALRPNKASFSLKIHSIDDWGGE